MITYDLAKELKNAGFPQTGIGNMQFHSHNGTDIPDGIIHPKNPTLSELIEACGDGFSCLIREPMAWRAEYDDGGISLVGTTPEEAVSRLWLALNEK